MRRLMVVAVIALALVRVRSASACECMRVGVVLGATQRVLPLESTLYVWTNPLWFEGQVELKVTMGGAPVPHELELVRTASAYSVYRLRIHAPSAGKLEVTPPATYEEVMKFDVVEERAPDRPAQIGDVRFDGMPLEPCDVAGWRVSIDGEAPAAYRLRGTLEGQPVDAYFPASDDEDEEVGSRPGRHQLSLSLRHCGIRYLDPDLRLGERTLEMDDSPRWKDVVLSRLDVDGTETEIAHGELDFEHSYGELPTFDPPKWPGPPPPPPPVATPAPVVAWWPVGAGAGGGLVLGGLGWLGLARRRRPR